MIWVIKNIEEETIKFHSEQNPSDFNKLIPELMNALIMEKQEGERTEMFEKCVLESTKKVFNF